VTFGSTTGQTHGNRVMHIRVVRAKDGAALRPWRALLRLIGLMLAVLPLFLGLLPILLTDRRRGLQDVIGGSVVIGVPEVPKAESPRAQAPLEGRAPSS
jgi:uncharacterized RDD family membrane protein YckC